jgi:hypothetical protein
MSSIGVYDMDTDILLNKQEIRFLSEMFKRDFKDNSIYTKATNEEVLKFKTVYQSVKDSVKKYQSENVI